jgi:hypothetical protein
MDGRLGMEGRHDEGVLNKCVENSRQGTATRTRWRDGLPCIRKAYARTAVHTGARIRKLHHPIQTYTPHPIESLYPVQRPLARHLRERAHADLLERARGLRLFSRYLVRAHGEVRGTLGWSLISTGAGWLGASTYVGARTPPLPKAVG